MNEYGEPWKWEGTIASSDGTWHENVALQDATGRLLIAPDSKNGPMALQRIMDRIVLCVNACRGFTDKELGTRTLVLNE